MDGVDGGEGAWWDYGVLEGEGGLRGFDVCILSLSTSRQIGQPRAISSLSPEHP